MPRFILILLLPLLRIAYWSSGFFPRKKNLWIFGSYINTFSDNSKYLYIHILENNPEIIPIWISGSKSIIKHIRSAGGRAYPRWSMRGLFYALRGKYWFVSSYVSDINYYASRGASVFNLWHGIPLKKIEFDIKHGVLERRFHRPSFLDKYLDYPLLFRKPEWILSTSDFVSKKSFNTAFRLPIDRCLAFGYPRLDQFFWPAEKQYAWLQRWASPSLLSIIKTLKKYQNVYVYMPTWRDSKPSFILEAGLDFTKINNELNATNSLLILKLHPATPINSIHTLRDFSNIYVMENGDDIYPLLPHSSALISDYSSVYLDYLLLDKPIYFFIFDLPEYLKSSRDFYYEYEKFTPGKKILCGANFFEIIDSVISDNHATERLHLRSKVFSHVDSLSSERIVKYIVSNYENNEIRS